jgi:hypothetical protein
VITPRISSNYEIPDNLSSTTSLPSHFYPTKCHSTSVLQGEADHRIYLGRTMRRLDLVGYLVHLLRPVLPRPLVKHQQPHRNLQILVYSDLEAQQHQPLDQGEQVQARRHHHSSEQALEMRQQEDFLGIRLLQLQLHPAKVCLAQQLRLHRLGVIQEASVLVKRRMMEMPVATKRKLQRLGEDCLEV